MMKEADRRRLRRRPQKLFLTSLPVLCRFQSSSSLFSRVTFSKLESVGLWVILLILSLLSLNITSNKLKNCFGSTCLTPKLNLTKLSQIKTWVFQPMNCSTVENNNFEKGSIAVFQVQRQIYNFKKVVKKNLFICVRDWQSMQKKTIANQPKQSGDWHAIHSAYGM